MENVKNIGVTGHQMIPQIVQTSSVAVNNRADSEETKSDKQNDVMIQESPRPKRIINVSKSMGNRESTKTYGTKNQPGMSYGSGEQIINMSPDLTNSG